MERLNSRITLTDYRKLNKIPTNKELKEIVNSYITYKDWYKNSLIAIKEKFHNYKFINNDTVDLLNINVREFNRI